MVSKADPATPVPYPEVAGLPFSEPQLQSYGSKSLQRAEYWPQPESEPLLILIHGGCWLNQFDLAHARPLASELTKLGIAVLSVEYRRIGDPGGGWPGTFNDIQLAIDHAKTLGHEQIFIAGHSAGGHLALWAATQNSELAGVIGLAAISNLAEYSKGTSGCQRATIDLMGGELQEVPARYQTHSPHQLEFSQPIHLIHGEKDPIVDIQMSMDFCANQNCDLTTLSGKGHFDVIDPRQEVATLIHKQILQWLPGDE